MPVWTNQFRGWPILHLLILAGAIFPGSIYAESHVQENPGCNANQAELTTELDERFLGRYFQNGRWQSTFVLEPVGRGYFSSRMRTQIRNITRGWIYRYNERRIPLTWGVQTENGEICISAMTMRKPRGDEIVNAMTIELRYAHSVERRPLYAFQGDRWLGHARRLSE